MNPRTGASILLAALLLLGPTRPGNVYAGDYTSAAISGKVPVADPKPASERSLFDNIWGLATLYENDDNPFVQKIAFTGRFQAEYAHVDGLAGQNYDEWVVRRWRMGVKAKLFENFTLHGEADFNPQSDPFYRRLTDAYLAWSPNDALKIKAGKQSIPFTQDGRTSSKELLTIDRSNIANNFWFPQEYLPGVSAGGKINNWRYFTGIYSTGTASPEFGDFTSGQAGIASIGYDFAECLNADEALLYFDYVYNDTSSTAGDTFTRNLRTVGSINFHYENGNVGFRADSAVGDGIGSQSNLIGFSAMPYYNFTEKLQGVLRYTFIDSEDPNGIRLARYESRATSGTGDRYHEGYVGLNYFLYGHKLKLQSGLKYTAMEDSARDGGAYYGWDWTTGLRISW